MIFNAYGETLPSADALVDAVNSAYSAGAWKVKLNPDDVLRWMMLPWGGPLIIPQSEVQATIAANYRTLGDRIKRWQTDQRAYAEAGSTPEGIPFGWDKWQSLAKDLGDEAVYQAGLPWDSSQSVALTGALAQTAVDIRNLFGKALDTVGNPSNWKWLGIAAGVVGAIYVIGIFRR